MDVRQQCADAQLEGLDPSMCTTGGGVQTQGSRLAILYTCILKLQKTGLAASAIPGPWEVEGEIRKGFRWLESLNSNTCVKTW